MEPNYYSIVPASVRYDNYLIPNAKLLYSEISAMTNQDGYCWAENVYFAKLYQVSVFTISRWISDLEKRGHIVTELDKKNGNSRKIFLSNILKKSVTKIIKKSPKKITKPIDEKRNTYCEKTQYLLTKSARPIDEKRKSIYDNNTSNNTSNREDTPLAFLELNYPSEFEILMMQFKSKINDYQNFVDLFNATFELEKREYDIKVISGRFKKFAIHWINNSEKFNKNEISDTVKQVKVSGF